MKQILIYGDSLSRGVIPGTRKRFTFEKRWPGIMEKNMVTQGFKARVIENCLNGRRTAWEDPFLSGRNGLSFLSETIEMHSPLDLIVVMLGTNDFQSAGPDVQAWKSAMGLERLISEIRQTCLVDDISHVPIIIISPPKIKKLNAISEEKFCGAPQRSKNLSEYYRKVANKMGCEFIAAEDYIKVSEVDFVHLDADAHIALGGALTIAAEKLLFSEELS